MVNQQFQQCGHVQNISPIIRIESNTFSSSGSCKIMSDYDESCYPGPAEPDSDGEASPREQTSLSMDSGPPHDFTCSVCSDILLNPVSLHCGHTFCQLCLAGVWQSSGRLPATRLACPVCRLPWRNFPGVNITLRNIIDKSHSDLELKRREAEASQHDDLLREFNSAKEGSWKEERQQRQTLMQHVNANVVMGLCIIIIALIVILALVIVLGGALWMWSGADSEYMRKPVSEWRNSDVVSWVEGLGHWTQPNITRIFINEAITGSQLLKLDKRTLSSFGILSEFRQETILDAIEILRKNDFSVPRNLHEFMAAHRKHTFAIAILYKLWPRFAFFYIYTFSYDGVFVRLIEGQFHSSPAESIEGQEEIEGESIPADFEPGWAVWMLFWLELLIVPHFIVLWFALDWWWYHPWICTAIIVHCVMAVCREIIVAIGIAVNSQTWKYHYVRFQLKRLGVNIIEVLLTGLCLSLFWPFIPHFLCDFIFYFVIWHSIIVKPLWKFCNLRITYRRNIRVQ